VKDIQHGEATGIHSTQTLWLIMRNDDFSYAQVWRREPWHVYRPSCFVTHLECTCVVESVHQEHHPETQEKERRFTHSQTQRWRDHVTYTFRYDPRLLISLHMFFSPSRILVNHPKLSFERLKTQNCFEIAFLL